MSTEQTLHSLDVLLLSESRKVIQVVERLIQHPTNQVISRLAIRRRERPIFPLASSCVSSIPLGKQEFTYSVSLTFLRSFRRFATSALRTSAASESVRVSTCWNSPRFSDAEASSLPGGGGFGRDVRFDMVAVDICCVYPPPSFPFFPF